jgi:hypothetical protein
MKRVGWLGVIEECRGEMKRSTGRARLGMSYLLDKGLAGRIRDKNARRCQDENPDRCIEGCTSLI